MKSLVPPIALALCICADVARAETDKYDQIIEREGVRIAATNSALGSGLVLLDKAGKQIAGPFPRFEVLKSQRLGTKVIASTREDGLLGSEHSFFVNSKTGKRESGTYEDIKIENGKIVAREELNLLKLGSPQDMVELDPKTNKPITPSRKIGPRIGSAVRTFAKTALHRDHAPIIKQLKVRYLPEARRPIYVSRDTFPSERSSGRRR